MANSEDLGTDHFDTTCSRLRSLVGLVEENQPRVASSRLLPFRTLGAGDETTTASVGQDDARVQPSSKSLDENLLAFLQSQDQLIRSLGQELQECKVDLQFVRQQTAASAVESTKLINELKNQVIRSLSAKRHSAMLAGDTEDVQQVPNLSFLPVVDVAQPKDASFPSSSAVANASVCLRCSLYERELRNCHENEAKLLAKFSSAINFADSLAEEKLQTELKSGEVETQVALLQQKQDGALAKLNGEMDAKEKRLDEMSRQIQAYRLKLTDFEQAEAKLKVSVETLEEANKQLKQQIALFRNDLLDRESEVNKRVTEMQSLMTLAVKEKLNVEDACKRLSFQLEQISETSKVKISHLDKELSEAKAKLTEAQLVSNQERTEFSRLTEKAQFLEKEISSLTQEKLRLSQDLRQNFSTTSASGAVQAAQYESRICQIESILHQQVPLIDKLLSHCKLLTEKLEVAGRSRQRHGRHT